MMATLTLILVIAMMVALIAFASIGLFTFWHVVVRSKREPADTSNRINHIRLWWFALTREDKFVSLFPWLTRDEWDNQSNSK